MASVQVDQYGILLCATRIHHKITNAYYTVSATQGEEGSKSGTAPTQIAQQLIQRINSKDSFNSCTYLPKLVRATCSYEPDAVRSEPHLCNIIHVEGLQEGWEGGIIGILNVLRTASSRLLALCVHRDSYQVA